MELFNILKPDILNDQEALEFYFTNMKKRFNISDISLFQIDNWIEISKLIYEQDFNSSNLNEEDILKKRKQILTTILGYYIYYQNAQAYLSLYNINNVDENVLKSLSIFKKELRKNFVLNTNKYYLKILNSYDIDYSLSLSSIDLANIDTKTVVIPPWQEFTGIDYQMIFFNKIHFPNPYFSDIFTELQIIEQNDILNENKLVRRINL